MVVRRLRVIALVTVACLLVSAPVCAAGYVGVKTGAGAGEVGVELEFPLYDRLSLILEGGVGAAGAASAVGGAIGIRGYTTYGEVQPFATGYVGSVSASYFSWYTGPMTVNVSYYGGTIGAKYERGNWYISGELGYAYVPAISQSGLLFGASAGLKF